MSTHTKKLLSNQPWLIIDVESVGLHGEGYAVAGGVFIAGVLEPGTEFVFACHPDKASGLIKDRAWISVNIPPIKCKEDSVNGVRYWFWEKWLELKTRYPDILMAGECVWPVEAKFLEDCVKESWVTRNFEGPYPLHEIATFMLAAGMDPMENWDRLPDELPKHDPMADVRLSARILHTAITKIESSR